jgi:hypothetical protein
VLAEKTDCGRKNAQLGGLLPQKPFDAPRLNQGSVVKNQLAFFNTLLDVLDDFVRLETAGAELDRLGRSIDDGLYFEKVGPPGSPGAVLRMGYCIAEHVALTANLAYSRHGIAPVELVKPSISKRNARGKCPARSGYPAAIKAMPSAPLLAE